MNSEVMIVMPNGDVFYANLESFPSIGQDSPWIVLSISKGFWYTYKDKATTHRVNVGDLMYIHSVSSIVVIKKGEN